jgi:hypothetical protein
MNSFLSPARSPPTTVELEVWGDGGKRGIVVKAAMAAAGPEVWADFRLERQQYRLA